jgi:hypothetical protein
MLLMLEFYRNVTLATLAALAGGLTRIQNFESRFELHSKPG